MKPTELYNYLRSLVRENVALRAVPRSGLMATDSRLGGQPYAEHGDRWPACARCESQLAFIGQLDLRTAGHGLAKKLGLVTFYYCWTCKPWADAPMGAWQLRSHPHAAPERAVELFPFSPPARPLRQVALEPEELKSLPDYGAIASRHPKVRRLLATLHDASPWDVYNDAAEALTGAPRNRAFAQVGGYPRWVQGEATPRCYECRKRMTFLWQISSEPQAELMFADGGQVYLFTCRKHDEFGFVLQAL